YYLSFFSVMLTVRHRCPLAVPPRRSSDLIVIGTKALRRFARQRRQQIDAERHVAGFDDGGPPGERGDLLFLLGGEAGRADNVRDAGLGGEARIGKARRRGGEINERVRAGDLFFRSRLD